MKQSACKIIQIGLIVTLTSVAQAQSVTPITTTTVIPTTAASPVVTAATSTTATTTTSTVTMSQIYLQYMADQEAAYQAQLTAQAEAKTRAQQYTAVAQMIQMCPIFRETQAEKTRSQVEKFQKKIGEKADDPNSVDPSISDEAKKGAADSKAAVGDLPETCTSFIKDKGGELGSVGSKIIAEVRINKSSFADKVPKDIAKYCPNYKTMDEQQRNMFWVWTMMSMANTESSCNPRAENEKNKDAKGLFQLDSKNCAKNLMDAMDNAECAVKRLATEMDTRGSLFANGASSSKNAKGTYWAAICSGGTKNCGNNGDSAKKTMAMISKYEGCGGAQASSDEPKKSANAKKKPTVNKRQGERQGKPPGGTPPTGLELPAGDLPPVE